VKANRIEGYAPWCHDCDIPKGPPPLSKETERKKDFESGKPDYWEPMKGQPLVLKCGRCKKHKPLAHFKIRSRRFGRAGREALCRECRGMDLKQKEYTDGLLGGVSLAPDILGMCIGEKAGEEAYK